MTAGKTEKDGRGGKRPGSGRKKLPDNERVVKIAITLAPASLKTVDILAAETGKTRSKIITEFVEEMSLKYGRKPCHKDV
jgi:hypothetical protein